MAEKKHLFSMLNMSIQSNYLCNPGEVCLYYCFGYYWNTFTFLNRLGLGSYRQAQLTGKIRQGAVAVNITLKLRTSFGAEVWPIKPGRSVEQIICFVFTIEAPQINLDKSKPMLMLLLQMQGIQRRGSYFI